MDGAKFTLLEGLKIHYLTRGKGLKALLLIHGAVGSTNDFVLQLDRETGIDFDQFTVVAYDLPGYGKSELDEERMPLEPTREYFELCASIGAKLMSQLKFKTYSVAGWSDGARVASILATKHQSRVDTLTLWGFLAAMDERSTKAISRTRDIYDWNPLALRFYTSVYGEARFSELWRGYVDYVVAQLEEEETFDIGDELSKIKCPTLILHGASDPLVSFQEHVEPLHHKIYDSRIVTVTDMSHNIHQANSQWFNRVLSAFMLEGSA